MTRAFPIRSRRGRLQFRLIYLIYLLTLAGVVFAVLRRALEIQGGWWFNVALTVYVGALVTYFALRFPFVVRRILRANRHTRVQRAKLAEYVQEVRAGRSEGDP